MADELLRIRSLAKNLPLFCGVKRFHIAVPRQEQVWIRNMPELIAKIFKLKADGPESIDVVTDYDYTLTKFRDDGKHCQSLFGMWGASKHLPEDFRSKLISTYLKYGPFETDPTISFVQKVSLLDEFYKIQKKLLVDHHLNLINAQKIMNDSHIVFRYGAKYFFNRSAELGIPVYIISGGISDILYNTMHSIVRDKRLDNVHTYANRLKWLDSAVIGFEEMTIHSYNKFRVIPELVRERKNCILMGDLVTDYYMTLKCKYSTQISIFYAKQGEVEQRKAAMKKFDIIVESDESLRFAIFLMNFVSNATLDMEYLKGCHPKLATFLNEQHRSHIDVNKQAVLEKESVAAPQPSPKLHIPPVEKQIGVQKHSKVHMNQLPI